MANKKTALWDRFSINSDMPYGALISCFNLPTLRGWAFFRYALRGIHLFLPSTCQPYGVGISNNVIIIL